MGNSNHKPDMFEQVNLRHFKFLQAIGKGGFSKVRMVEHKITKKRYALKYMSKKEVINKKLTTNILKERDMLVSCHHNFICNLRFAFQDDWNLYMVLDLMLGGDLRFHLNRREFSEEEIVFIMAEIMAGLGYLHNLDIVHRDIKPDNILFDTKGHAHLADFNVATYIDPGSNLKSTAGTYHYMAAEMIRGEEYNHSIDWWSLGVTIYESVFGVLPYNFPPTPSERVAILSNPIIWSDPLKVRPDSDLIQLLKKLLTQNPHKRTPVCNQGFATFQKDPTFSNIDWPTLHQKKATPHFCPNTQQSNFDQSHNLEELFLEEAPLEALPSHKNKKKQTVNPEIQRFEDEYHCFDFYATIRGRRYSVDYSSGAPSPDLSGDENQVPTTPRLALNILNNININSHPDPTQLKLNQTPLTSPKHSISKHTIIHQNLPDFCIPVHHKIPLDNELKHQFKRSSLKLYSTSPLSTSYMPRSNSSPPNHTSITSTSNLVNIT